MEDTVFCFLFAFFFGGGGRARRGITHLWIDHVFMNIFVNRGKRNKKQDSKMCRVGYHKNNNKMAVPDMIDNLTVVADIEEENRCDL